MADDQEDENVAGDEPFGDLNQRREIGGGGDEDRGGFDALERAVRVQSEPEENGDNSA